MRPCDMTDTKDAKADCAKATKPEQPTNRRKNKAKKYEYETKRANAPIDGISWVKRTTLTSMGEEG